MEIELLSRHVELTDKVRDYVDKKIGRLDRYLPDIKATRVELSHGTKRSRGEVYKAQITTWVDSAVLRAEEMEGDLYAAIDLASDKLHRQIERYRGRRLDRWHESGRDMLESGVDDESPADSDSDLVRRKSFAMHPMDEREAIEQLDLLGHDFYLFMHHRTGLVNVVYRRKDGGYGLIEPVIA
jgi:putative sigma-54 modulation protein